jgi:hypothetical protein
MMRIDCERVFESREACPLLLHSNSARVKRKIAESIRGPSVLPIRRAGHQIFLLLSPSSFDHLVIYVCPATASLPNVVV